MKNSNNYLIASNISKSELPAVWNDQQQILLRDAVDAFLMGLTPHTKRSYNTAFEMCYSRRLLNPHQTLREFSQENLENLLDRIRTNAQGKSESTKQARAAAFISFTGFLQRRTNGIIKKAIPSREKSNPTFKTEKHKSTTEALEPEQMYAFFRELKKVSVRDYLIAKTALQGAKRISEVLNAKVEDINWEKNQITFFQLKSKERDRRTIITYPKSFMKELKEAVGDRTEGYIFTSKKGGKLQQAHLWRSFVGAGVSAGIPYRVHPHVLRATAITYFVERGYTAEQIAKVSGHASLKQVAYYDRSDLEKNLTMQVSII